MSTMINDDSMSLEIGDRVIATAELGEHPAANGHGAWIVSCHPGRLFTRNQVITAMVLAERLAPATAMATRSCPAGARNWACDRPAHQDHHSARGGGRCGRRRDHLLSARLRTGALAWRVWRHGPAATAPVDGLIWAAFMVVLDASRPNQARTTAGRVEPGAGIVATVGANLAHGVGHGPVGALVSAWPALALTARQTWLTWLPALPGPPCRPSARPAMQLSRQVDDRVWAGPDAGKRALPSWYSPARSAGRPGTLSWNSAERSGSVTGHSAIARQRAETGRLVGPCRTSPSR